jgi:SNF2 family DNA or RNA helicase
MLLADGAHFSLLVPRLQSLRQLIDEARGLTDAPSGQLRISRYQAGLWAELAALGVVTEQAQAWQRQVSGLLELDAVAAERDPPATLTARLRPYQREGFHWLASLYDLDLGGILADDMGLGKTVQALAAICHARERDPAVGPFLVVAPTSVVSNWVAEASRFAPDMRVRAVTDTLAKSGRALGDIVAATDVVVTTTRSCGSSPTPTARSVGPGSFSTRRRTSRTTSRRPTTPRGGSVRRSRSRSPARRWRTT